jgi:NHLM bacteriocin system ABC transporter ATP-binding protein
LDDEQIFSQDVIDDVLRYYHERPVEIPADVTDPYKQLEYAFRPSGLMMRDVELDDGWYHHAYGVMIGYLKDSGRAVALMPGTFSGYWFVDPTTGKKTKVGKKTSELLSRDALCFYYPLPRKPLGITDLVLFMKKSISRGDILAIVLATLAVTVTGMIEPGVYNLLTGTVLKLGQMHLFVGVGSFLLASAFASIMLGLVRDLLVERINIKTSLSVESSVMMRVLSLPLSFFSRYSSGELASRVGSVSSLCNAIVQNVFSLGLSGFVSLLYVTQIFHFAPGLVIPALVIILATMVVSVVSSVMQVRVSRQIMQIQARENGLGYAVLNGIQKIKLAGAEKRVFSLWGNLYAKQAELQYHPPLFLRLNAVITQAISLVGTIALYSIALGTGVGVSQYYAFTAAFGRLSAAFTALAGIAISVAQIRPILEMAEPILKAEPEVTGDKPVAGALTGRIEVNDVSFRYGENQPYVFRDLSMTIRAGEYVAIVGRTGCGKSTLVRLLLGFEKPENGSVFYDNYDLSHTDPVSIRKSIGAVMQNGQLLMGDIYSNITLSAPLLSVDEAWEAAEVAAVADDIRNMPMGMHTLISEGAGGISGGQKQRLLIARAVAPKPKILIFDEATSALDNITQKQVSEALDAMKCTRLVIAHRLSTIRHCDRILFVENGEIAEEGTYEELIEKNGKFADLVARQRLE